MRGWIPKAGLSAFSLALSAVLMEILLRMVFGAPVHFRYPQERYVVEPVIGHWLEPEQRTYTHDEPVEVNSAGLRGPERARALGPGQCRILALGDSQTFGDGLAYPETWPSQLEALLAESGAAPEVQVLNAGISATDTWQHEHVLRRVGTGYDYDAVVLAFYVNDVTPRYEPRQATSLTNTSTKRMGYALKRSALFTFLWQLYQKRGSGSEILERERRILEDDPDDTTARAWAQVEESLRAMKAEASSAGASFSLVILPRRDQVSADDPPRGYNRRVGAIAKKLRIPTLDVLQDLREAYAIHGQKLFIPWDGHNTAVANAIISRRILETFGATLCSKQALRAGGSVPSEPPPAR